jgi:hypothetical protein
MRPVRKAIPLILFSCLLGRSQVNILTANGGNDRANANLQETQLTTATVSPVTFGKLGIFPVDAPVFAQPLYVSGLSIPDAGKRNVLFVATMHNSIYAFDADRVSAPVMLWQANLGTAVPAPLLFGRYGDIGGEVGILGTPVVDLQRGVMYVVSDNIQDAAPAFNLHALDLATGAERLGGPVTITGSVSGQGSAATRDGMIVFDAMQHIQRPGLLLANGAVYVCFGSHQDQSPYHGWIISYDASDLTRQVGLYISTPNGDGGSFWQSGRGPAADENGTIYAITGNGDYDGTQNFAESLLKLAGAAPVRKSSFTPPDWKSLSDNDADLSAGPVLITGTHKVLIADKAGNLYLVDGESMSSPNVQNSFQKMPVSRGPIFNFAVWNRSSDARIYVQGSGEPLRSFQITPAGLPLAPLSTASDRVPYSRIGMTISANGTQDGTGIVWEITGNYNDSTTSGILHAFDASDLTNELWSSAMNPDRDTMGPVVKFVSPTVANGKVYAPNLANAVVVYGLMP